jgi:tetratricopeptide (TPR) repeat protein
LRQIILVFQQLGAVTFEATIHANLAATLQQQGKLPEAIASLETAIAILKKYNLPQSAGGGTVQRYEAILAELKGETPTQADQMEQVMRQLLALYQQAGADAVRDMFKGQVPEEVIENLLAQLAQLSGGDEA